MERPFSEFVDFHPTFVVFAGSLLDRLMILPLGAQSSIFRANASLGSPKAPLSQKRHRKPQARLFLGQRRLLGAPLGAFAPKKGAPAPKKGARPKKRGPCPKKDSSAPKKRAFGASNRRQKHGTGKRAEIGLSGPLQAKNNSKRPEIGHFR